MNLSPLSKQVQQMNKQIENQNIQIKDLLQFLNKSIDKQNRSLKQNKKLQQKDKIASKQNEQDCIMDKQSVNKKFSRKDNIFYKDKIMKNALKQKSPQNQFARIVRNRSHKQLTYQSNNIQLIHSIKLLKHKQSLKQLKLSKPQRKLNSSCSFCNNQSSRLTSSYLNQKNSIVLNKKVDKTQRYSKQNCHKQSINSQITNRPVLRLKNQLKRSNSKMLKLNDPSNQTTNLNSKHNQLLLKHQLRSFMEKKSFNYKLNSSKTITINNKKNANNLTKSIIIKK